MFLSFSSSSSSSSSSTSSCSSPSYPMQAKYPNDENVPFIKSFRHKKYEFIKKLRYFLLILTPHKQYHCGFDHLRLMSCIVLYCIDGAGHCFPIHCDLFKIYCAPPNLGITRVWICRLNFTRRPIFLGLKSLTSLKSQTREPQLKVPSGGHVLKIFTSWKNPSTSAGFEPAHLGSRGEHVTPRPPRLMFDELNLVSILFSLML